jgi:hypothetical protein
MTLTGTVQKDILLVVCETRNPLLVKLNRHQIWYTAGGTSLMERGWLRGPTEEPTDDWHFFFEGRGLQLQTVSKIRASRESNTCHILHSLKVVYN